MYSQLKPRPPRTTPPITRQGSKNRNLSHRRVQPTQTHSPPPLIRSSTPTETLSPSQTESQVLYEHSQPLTNPNIIQLSTPESQMTQPLPTRSETNLLEENMEINQDPLSDSVTEINLSGILNKTILPQPPSRKTMQFGMEFETERTTFLDSKGKRLKSALIVIAKASHHKNFMETCLARRQPPKNMTLWVQPHIYHSNTQVEKQWRDTLKEAELSLTSTLIQHYSSIIEAEKQTLEIIKKEIAEYLKLQNPREEAIENWKKIRKQAEDEARKLSESLKETRINKLHRKRQRSDSMQNLVPEGQRQQLNPNPLIQALHGFLNDYSKNEQPQQEHREYRGKGKEPAHGRGILRKGGPPSGH